MADDTPDDDKTQIAQPLPKVVQRDDEDSERTIFAGALPDPEDAPAPDETTQPPVADVPAPPIPAPPMPSPTIDPEDATQIAPSVLPPVVPDGDPDATQITGISEAPAVEDLPSAEPDPVVETPEPVEETPPAPQTAPPVDEPLTEAPEISDPVTAAPVTEAPVAAPEAPITQAPVTEVPEPEATPEPAPEPEPEPVLEKTPPPAPAASGGNEPVPIGTVINNNYEIKQLINAGGMGEVFRGENTFTGDAVAIKIVLQSLAHDPKIASLFMREAKVLCGLSDQAIVRYYNFVKDAELDRFCLIMEYISGVPLNDYVRDTARLTDDQAKGLIKRLALGLDRAHQMDVVHRDLSPDNVMLRDGNVEEAVLIDFGIAKSSEMAESTLHGQLAGKFKYISPEQLGHFGGEIGPRTDIYGLALLMAAALKGEPLDMGSSIVEAVNARREIPDLSDMPDSLRPLLSYMLEPDPAHRPARMSDVIYFLENPSEISAKHGEAPVVEAAAGNVTGLETTGLGTPGMQQTTGLSIVPGAAGATTSASPFGEASIVPNQPIGSIQTQAGQIAQPGQQTMYPASEPARSEGGGIGTFLRWIIVLGMLGGAGYYFVVDQDVFELNQVENTDDDDVLPDEPVQTAAGGPVTRTSFLADYDAGACGFATRISGGPQAGTIATFGDAEADFSGLLDGYEGVFDSRPGMVSSVIAQTQCPALDLARSLTKNAGTPPLLTLDSDVMQSGGSIVGRLSDRRGRPVWVALITAAGGVYNLTDRLTEQADGSVTFSFGLNAAAGADPEPQMIIAIAADSPLIATATATDGSRADSLLPLIEAEIAGKSGEAGAALGYFSLAP